MTDGRLAPPSFDPADAAAAAARFAADAPVDVAYAVTDSPLGTLVLAATDRGLAVVSYADFDGGVDAALDRVALRLSPRMLELPTRLDAPRRQLEEYFGGARTTFELDIDWALVPGFGRRVLEATAAIPFGQVSTYGAIAAQAGNARAPRAAGRALGANPVPIVIPCHRVLNASGALHGYTGGLERKERLLRLEGVVL